MDVVADICNRVFTRFAAGVFDFPLKLGMGNTVDVNVTTDIEDGFTEEELYTALSTGFICIFNNFDVTKSFVVNQEARAVAKKLGDILMENTKGGGIGDVVEGLKDRLHSIVHDDETERQTEEKVLKEKERLALKGYGKAMLQRYVDKGKKAGWGVERVVWEQMFVLLLFLPRFIYLPLYYHANSTIQSSHLGSYDGQSVTASLPSPGLLPQ